MIYREPDSKHCVECGVKATERLPCGNAICPDCWDRWNEEQTLINCQICDGHDWKCNFSTP